MQQFLVVLRGALEHGVQRIVRTFRFARCVGLGQLDPRARRQEIERLAKAQPVVLFEKTDHIATDRTGAETVPSAAGRIDLERGRALVVKRAAGAPKPATLAQPGHALAHEFLDGNAQLDLLNGLFEVVGHGESAFRAAESLLDKKTARLVPGEGGARRTGSKR